MEEKKVEEISVYCSIFEPDYTCNCHIILICVRKESFGLPVTVNIVRVTDATVDPSTN